MRLNRYTKDGYEIKGWVYFSNQIFRFFSIPLAKMLSRFPIRAEQVCLASLISGILSALLFTMSYSRLGSVFFVIFWLLDYTDGDLARMKSQATQFGGWLDSLAGKIVTPLIYGGICISCAKTHDPAAIWVIGYTILSFYYVFGMVEKTTAYIRNKLQPIASSSPNFFIEKSVIQVIGREIMLGHNTLYWLLIIGTSLNKLYLTLIISTSYAVLFAGYIMYSSYKEIKALEVR